MEIYENLTVDSRDGVVDIVLNRPDKRNALTIGAGKELSQVVHDYLYDASTKVAILRGNGKSFCAGFDLNEKWSEGSARERWLDYNAFRQLFLDFEKAPVVKIAQVHGHAMGGGLVLAAICELRYGAYGTKIGIPEVNLGAPFSMGGLPRVTRIIGLTRAAEMVLTGEPVEITSGYDAGFFSAVLSEESLADRVSSVATGIAERSSLFLIESVNRLHEIANLLVGDNRDDLTALLASQLDSESLSKGSSYVEGFSS